MSVDLSRARIVELKHRLDDWETVALRYELGGSWELAGDIKRWTDDELHVTFKVFQVLAEFPVTLADLVPDGCTEFRFKDQTHRSRVAMQHPDGQWEVTGMHGEWQDLNALQFDCDANVPTVTPLQVSDQHVEERR